MMLFRAELVVVWMIQSVFTRVSEWGLSLTIFAIGWGLMAPGATFDYTSRLWRVLSVVSENTWGWIMVTIGLASLYALAVNGRQPRLTSGLRIFCAVARAAVWFMLAATYIIESLRLGSFLIQSAMFSGAVLMDWAVIMRARWEHRNAGRP